MAPGLSASRLAVERVPVIDSTNSELLRREPLLAPGSGAAAVWLVATRQTAGRGRRLRGWLASPAASLTASFGREIEDARGFGALSLVAGVAVAESLDGFGVAVRLKWPNDLYVARRGRSSVGCGTDAQPDLAKAGGILCEARARGTTTRLVVGVGLNLIAPAGAERLDQPIHGLFDEGKVPDRDALAEAVGLALLAATDRLLADGFGPFRDRWIARDLLRERDVLVLRQGGAAAARVRGIDDDGALRVEYVDRPGQTVRLLSEEVSIRPVAWGSSGASASVV